MAGNGVSPHRQNRKILQNSPGSRLVGVAGAAAGAGVSPGAQQPQDFDKLPARSRVLFTYERGAKDDR
jgi:hypothetical protein